MIAATAGAGLGAPLGYGLMLRYKSEGVLDMDMGASEYKRFTELAVFFTMLAAMYIWRDMLVNLIKQNADTA